MFKEKTKFWVKKINEIMYILSFLRWSPVMISLMLLFFISCGKSNDIPKVNKNEYESYEVTPDTIFDNQPEEVVVNESEQVIIPKESFCRYIKVWEDGFENEVQNMKSSLVFSDDRASLTLTLANRTKLKLRCVKAFETNKIGETYGTYILPNGEEIVIGYFGENEVQWYVKFKDLNGTIQEAELSNSKNAWR